MLYCKIETRVARLSGYFKQVGNVCIVLTMNICPSCSMHQLRQMPRHREKVHSRLPVFVYTNACPDFISYLYTQLQY